MPRVLSGWAPLFTGFPLSWKIKSPKPIEFVMDTGADKTIIGLPDTLRLEIDYSGLERITLSGIGGKTDDFSYHTLP